VPDVGKRQTLYDPSAEIDACGIGFIADVSARPSRAIVDHLLEGLRRVRHRGAVSGDRRTGDGAGLLLPIPDVLRRNSESGLAMVFLRDEADRRAIEAAHAVGRVPWDGGRFGRTALGTSPGDAADRAIH
jgi:glutamate synthase domain-containing protein 1